MLTPDFVNINNRKIPIQDWSFTLFQLCDSLGITIPRFCYHERLSIAGNCRMCMVEVTSSLKPVVACATSLTKGMTVLTHSALAKRARENVLEFLLINHPLDCPICDQGGECDLQDQAVAYGSDKGRFAEVKRSVEDKHFGPIVKTVMTRCIHCTRCVRFFEEVAGTPVLGTMGRGKSTEISTYVSTSMLNSNISGNVIDLCPVGALTSKPHAFLYRPWELTSVETIDTSDSLCSNIRVDLKGSEIVRILPKRNDLINDDWISDVTRYGYEGLKQNRLSIPLHRSSITGRFIASGWSSFFEAFVSSYSTFSSTSAVIQFGPNVDLFTIYLSHYFSKLFNSVSYNLPSTSSVSSVESRSNYLLHSSFSDLESSDLVIFSNIDLQNTLPVVQARLRKGTSTFLSVGVHSNLLLDQLHIGLSNTVLGALLRGKSSFSSLLSSAKSPFFISNGLYASSFTSSISSLTKLKFSTIRSDTTSIHSSEVGLVSTLGTFSNPSVYYAIDATSIVSDMDLASDCFSVYQGSNSHPVKTKVSSGSVNSWYVPATSMFESEVLYINLLGYIQLTRKFSTRLGLSLSNSSILTNLFMHLLKVHPVYNNFSVNSSFFYTSFFDNIVVFLEDCSSITSSSMSFEFLKTDTVTSFECVSTATPTYVAYSNTLTSVNSLRTFNTF